jgi:transaldolase
MMNSLEQLKQFTLVVADTGDFDSIDRYKPTDATTNPSLILAASNQQKYLHLFGSAVQYGKKSGNTEAEKVEYALEMLSVNFGIEILKIVPGRVSTEVDAHFSFDTEGSIRKALKIIHLYETNGIRRDRILIKLASTWEGILAARELERQNIHCNMTLLFSMAQAIACAEAGVRLISPFVGRIYDWYKIDRGVDHIPGNEDPGVISVRNIYEYYKKFGYQTEIMGASFRNIEEIIELAGCDLLTIAPSLLEVLETSGINIERKLDPVKAVEKEIPKVNMDEKLFRWMHNEDPMAVEKLSEGIRRFAADARKLEGMIINEL